MRGKKLGMALFLVSDAFTFASLLVAYWYLRIANAPWPRPFDASSLLFAILMTLCLLTGSFAMVKASRGAHRWIGLAITGGVIFAGLHLVEWLRLPATGTTLFRTTFFALTGFHMAHVIGGVVYLWIVAARAKSTNEDVQAGGLYWHFVDAVWLVLFLSVYLTSTRFA